MKAHLMFADADFDPDTGGPPRRDALVADLELATLFSAMSLGDAWLYQVVEKAVTLSLKDPAAIRYRQRALADSIENETAVRQLYDFASHVIAAERQEFFTLGRSPSSVMYRAAGLLDLLSRALANLRSIADAQAAQFKSEAFSTLFATLQAELSDEYLATVDRHLHELRFRDGLLLSAQLGEGNKGTDYVLRGPLKDERGWFARLLGDGGSDRYTIRISDRDEAGARALAELRDRGLNLVANAAAQSADHLLSFFEMLRTELAFYVGCLNLRARLEEVGQPTCFPEPVSLDGHAWHAEDLYDPCLALTAGSTIVRNRVDANDRELVVITGANQGGKSTFLRSIGLSYLMMQCGMFGPARLLRASVSAGIFTHYRREEDEQMTSGKLDEELGRMSDIADYLEPRCVVLFNESFASTNEREGSEIAYEIVSALLERNVRVFCVTHQYEFARAFRDDPKQSPQVLFLRAQRLDDGTRTFKIVEGAPLQTSYGADLYREVFQGSGPSSP